MNFTRAYAVFLRQIYLLRSNTSRWVMIFFWSIADLLIWGLLTKYLNEVGGARFNFITVLIGAVIFTHLVSRTQVGISVAQLEDVWARNLVNFFAAPLRLSEYILGLALTSLLTTAISLTVMAMLAWFLFRYSIFQFGFLLLPYIFILVLFGIALGLIAITVITRFGPAAETFAWIIPTAISPFSGVFYPVSTLPASLQFVASAIPSSYVFEGMRGVVLTGTFSMADMLIGLALALLYVVLGYMLLRYYFRQAVKKGLLIRFLTDAW